MFSTNRSTHRPILPPWIYNCFLVLSAAPSFLFFPLLISFRATTSAPSTSSSTTSTTPPRLPRRRSHKRKVDLDRLLQQLRLMGAFDRGAGFFKGRELDERVSLVRTSSAFDPQTSSLPDDLAYLYVTTPSIQVQMHVLDLAIFPENVL